MFLDFYQKIRRRNMNKVSSFGEERYFKCEVVKTEKIIHVIKEISSKSWEFKESKVVVFHQ